MCAPPKLFFPSPPIGLMARKEKFDQKKKRQGALTFWQQLSIGSVCRKANGGAMSRFKCAYNQKKPVFCPAPGSEIEPFEGLFVLINERRILPVRNAGEFLAKITDLKKKHVFQATLAQAKPSGRNSHKLVTA